MNSSAESTYQLVRLTRSEAPYLARVAAEVFDYELSAEGIEALLASPQQIVYLALADGLVIGQVRATVIAQPDAPAQLYLDNLGVTPAWKRRGVARALLAAATDAARSCGCHLLYVLTEPDNAEGLAFYRALGFRQQPVVLFEGTLEVGEPR